MFIRVLGTEAVLGGLAGGLAFVLLYVNLRLARRGEGRDLSLLDEPEAQPLQLPPWPSSDRSSTAAHAGLPGRRFLVGTPAAGRWPEAIRFQHAVSFGFADLLFGRDVATTCSSIRCSAAAYQLLFVTLLLALLVVAAVYVLSRGIQLATQRLVVQPWAKGHLLVLVAALLLAKVWGYVLDRYALLFSEGGAAFGASYADVNATLPGLAVVMGLAGLAAILCLVQVGRPGFRLAIAGWPSGSPGASSASRPIRRSSSGSTSRPTRSSPSARTSSDDRRHEPGVRAGPGRGPALPAREDLTFAVLQRNDATMKNIRLWDHRAAAGQLRPAPGDPALLHSWTWTSTATGRRRLPPGDARRARARATRPPSRPQTWINRRLQFTHGYGVVMGPVNQVTPGRAARASSSRTSRR